MSGQRGLYGGLREVGGGALRFHHYRATDFLYIGLTDRLSVESREVAAGVVLDSDAEDRLVGLDIDNASRAVDLETIEAEELPLGRLAAG